MQQWIPRTQTLEPKIWGQVGLRQGLYMGLGVFAGIFFLIALAPFGIGPRIAAALMSLAGGATVGFIKIKGLSPERYLFHRLRFAMRRQGTGVWQPPDVPGRPIEAERQPPDRRQEVVLNPVLAPATAQMRRVTLARAASTARWGECVTEVGPFGVGFYLVALSAMVAAVVYLEGSLSLI